MVSAVDKLRQIATVCIGVLKITEHFEVSAACVWRVNEHDACGVCEEAGRLFNRILVCSFDVFLCCLRPVRRGTVDAVFFM